MPHLTFAQSERPTLLGPIAIAVAVLLAAGVGFYLYIPHRLADITVTHTAVLPIHTIIQTDSKLIGHQQQPEDDLYVLATVRIANRLRIPLFLSDITSTLTTANDSVTTTSAIEKNDLSSVYTAFPAIQPLTGPPLLREATIEPGMPAEGMVLLRFPLTRSDWNNRKSATLTLTFYHQSSITLTIPKQ
jgi:hypothetical protein